MESHGKRTHVPNHHPVICSFSYPPRGVLKHIGSLKNFASRTCRDCHQHLAHPLGCGLLGSDSAMIWLTYAVHRWYTARWKCWNEAHGMFLSTGIRAHMQILLNMIDSHARLIWVGLLSLLDEQKHLCFSVGWCACFPGSVKWCHAPVHDDIDVLDQNPFDLTVRGLQLAAVRFSQHMAP